MRRDPVPINKHEPIDKLQPSTKMKKITAILALALTTASLQACIRGYTVSCGSIQCEGNSPYDGALYCTGNSSGTYTAIRSDTTGSPGAISLPPVDCTATCVVIDSVNAPITCTGDVTVYPQGPSTGYCSQG